MNHLDAFHHSVHTAPGGCESLAPRMGMSAAILRNKANPNSSTNKPTLDEADRLMALTGDYAVLHALAENHGFVCTRIDEQPGGDMAVLEATTDVWARLGDLGSEVHRALADGRIEPHEVKSIEAATFAAFRPMMQLLARVNDMAEKAVK
jgi:hypothetical protein